MTLGAVQAAGHATVCLRRHESFASVWMGGRSSMRPQRAYRCKASSAQSEWGISEVENLDWLFIGLATPPPPHPPLPPAHIIPQG